MVFKIKNKLKGFTGLLVATVIPTLIMFVIFASTYAPTITGIWNTVLVAGLVMVLYGFFISFIGMKKYMKR